jgi:hypothetical protein
VHLPQEQDQEPVAKAGQHVTCSPPGLLALPAPDSS